jgi:hypothetical protein
VGGIAAQTALLVIADKVYRPANLEHAAASVTNLINGALLALTSPAGGDRTSRFSVGSSSRIRADPRHLSLWAQARVGDQRGAGLASGA